MENEGLGDIVGIIGKTKKTRYSWASLSAKIYHPADDDYNAFYIQDARLVFDPDEHRYKIGNKGEISLQAIDGPSKTFINEPPDNYKISWGQFPSFIAHPEKDGVEEACDASEFKDKIFDISYRVIEKWHAKWRKSQCTDNSMQEGSRVYEIVYEYINFDKTLVSPKMYKWEGRYFNNSDYSDWIVVDGNNEQQPFS
jgi:hypothetical protein